MARLEELERKFEENPRRYFAPLANEYRKAGDAQRAADICRAQLPEVPGHISGHIVLGQALYDARDFDGSRAALETALALDPENIVALRYLGDIARDTGDSAEAERWYSRTLEADPYNEAATTALDILRSAPAVYSHATDDFTVEPLQRQPETNSLADGFEPTSYIEPELSEAGEPPPVSEIAPHAEIADAAAGETWPEMVSGAHPESAVIEFPEDRDTVAPTAGEAEPIAQAAAPVPEQSPTEESTSGQVEIADELEVEPAAQASAGREAPPSEILTVNGEFAGDLSVSAAVENAEPTSDEPSAQSVAAEEPFDVAAHAPAEQAPPEEAMQAEERVLESAAPFVTETMADLYLEQGYPHEALELLLQLSEQRPEDEPLRAKIEHIESVIVARRDAAVAAARAERAETADAAEAAEAAGEAEYAMEPPVEPFDAANAEIDSPAFAANEPEPEPDEPISVQELFSRMDRARPRSASAVTPRPISRRRSDFVPMPAAEATATEALDDPFAFPNPPAPSPVPRTSGPQQTFNPSTADSDDFNAWLRGLRGP